MIEKLFKNKTIMAIASIVIGIFLIVRRGAVADDMIRIIGYILIGAGVLYALSYFVGKDRDSVNIGYAAAVGLVGLLLVLMARTIVNIFPILVGILLILNGISNYTQAGNGGNKAVAIAMVAIGVLVVIFSRTVVNTIVLFLGIALVLNGLADLNFIRKFW